MFFNFVGNKSCHGLILYKADMDTYSKVQKLKASLHRYNLREYPPGPNSSDQQAGYCKLYCQYLLIQILRYQRGNWKL